MRGWCVGKGLGKQVTIVSSTMCLASAKTAAVTMPARWLVREVVLRVEAAVPVCPRCLLPPI